MIFPALMAIRDAKLYRETHDTFEAYCKERWGLERRRAYQLMDAATVSSNVNFSTQTPIHETHVRPLTALPPEKQATAWQEAVDTALPAE